MICSELIGLWFHFYLCCCLIVCSKVWNCWLCYCYIVWIRHQIFVSFTCKVIFQFLCCGLGRWIALKVSRCGWWRCSMHSLAFLTNNASLDLESTLCQNALPYGPSDRIPHASKSHFDKPYSIRTSRWPWITILLCPCQAVPLQRFQGLFRHTAIVWGSHLPKAYCLSMICNKNSCCNNFLNCRCRRTDLLYQ